MADFTPPQDYTSAFANVPSPIASFQQGLQSGFGMQQAQLQQGIQRYQFQRMQQMQQAAAQVAQNPTPENISQLSIAFPEMSEQFKRSYDMLQPQQQRADLQHMTEVHAAMQAGRPDIAAQLLNDRADALENSGSPTQMVQAARAAAQWAQTDPNTFKTASGVMLASITGPDKFASSFNDLATGTKTQQTTPAAVAQANADASTAITTAQNAPLKQQTDIAKTQADITNLAGRLQLDRDALMSQTQTKLRELQLQYGMPTPDQAKLINDSAMQAAAGEQSASRLNDLADRITQVDAAGRAYGRASDWSEIGRQVFGNQDATSALKQEYARIVNNQALGAIKESLGGRVTDVDMKVAMGPVPSPSANPSVVTSYLRGVAKLQTLDAARQQAQAEWLAQVGRSGTLAGAPHDITVMGTKVPQGTTFADFSRQFLQQKAEQISAQSALARAQGRSYLRFTQPQGGGSTGNY